MDIEKLDSWISIVILIGGLKEFEEVERLKVTLAEDKIAYVTGTYS